VHRTGWGPGMRSMKIILVIGALVLSVVMVWQVGSREVENVLLQGDMHDLASQVGVAATYSSPRSDEDFRAAVIRKARDHGIDLRPEQVTVIRPDAGGNTPMFLAADYSVTVDLPHYPFVMHFQPSSTKQFF
jgi:hypothetical protein